MILMTERDRDNYTHTNPYSGFSKLDLQERYDRLAEVGITSSDIDVLNAGLPHEIGDKMVENFVAPFGIPMGFAIGVPVDKRVYPVVAMVIEAFCHCDG